MADVQLGINQGDHIYYYDLSTGAVSRQWTFQGGTPSTSTVYGPDIRYYGVNYTGYSTGLVITGAGGITAAAYKPNIIVVYPELFNPIISVTYNGDEIIDSPMSRTNHYSVSGTVSSGIDSYSWYIPELGSGYYSPSLDFACIDWYSLTGSYIGSPNSSFLTSALVDITSVAGNEVTLEYGINFRKIGVQESVNYWNPGTYATSGNYYNFSTLSQRTSALGLGGNSLVFRIDLAPYSPKWNNTSFHSTQEVVYLWPNSPDVSKTYAPIKTNMVLVGNALSIAGVTGGYDSEPRVMTGNYIIPGDITSKFASKFFITDQVSDNVLTALVDGNRRWYNSSVNYFMENKYYLSGSSKFIELGGFYNTFFNPVEEFAKGSVTILPYADLASGYGYLNGSGGYAWDGGWATEDGADPIAWYHGVCIPSAYFMEDVYGYGDLDVDIRLILRDSAGSIIDDFEFIVSIHGGGVGNTPDLYLIGSSESGWGGIHGLAYLINEKGILGRGNGLSDNIIFEDNGYFAPYRSIPSGLYNDSSYFGGLRMSIKDPRTSSAYSNRYIHSVEIMWGSQMTDFINDGIINDLNFPLFPLASDINSTEGGMTSWTGLPSKIIVPASSYSTYFRGWKIGGALT